MEGEYGLTQEDEDVIESMPNVGYLKEVRYFSIENGLTSWAAIEFWDKIVEKLSDGKYPPGFSERCRPDYDADDEQSQSQAMGSQDMESQETQLQPPFEN